MKARDFVYWLQGYLEISNAGGPTAAFKTDQVECIQKHLNMVFLHEIDPSYGDKEHQGSPYGGPSRDP